MTQRFRWKLLLSYLQNVKLHMLFVSKHKKEDTLKYQKGIKLLRETYQESHHS